MISRKILESLSDSSISLDPNNIHGQAYDGASVMSSGKKEVQANIKEISPLALFTHCYAHCLNLSIAATCKLSEVRNMIGLINEAYLFLDNSLKRQKLFELALKEYLPASSHSKLLGLCKTRWVERHTCLDVFLEMYELLVTFLDAVVTPHARVPKFEIVYWKLELGQRYYHKSPGTESLFVVILDRSGFHYDQEYS